MRPSSISVESVPTRTFERLTLNQRIQHGVLVTSFTVLTITGLAVKYPDTFGPVGYSPSRAADRKGARPPCGGVDAHPAGRLPCRLSGLF